MDSWNPAVAKTCWRWIKSCLGGRILRRSRAIENRAISNGSRSVAPLEQQVPASSELGSLGTSFVMRYFYSAPDLASALTQGMHELIHEEAIMDLVNPLFRPSLLSDHRGAAAQIVDSLANPRQTELQRAILQFIRSRRYLHFCLRSPSTPRRTWLVHTTPPYTSGPDSELGRQE